MTCHACGLPSHAPAIIVFVPGIPASPNVTRTRSFHVNAAEANQWKSATCVAAYEAVKGKAPRLTHARVELVIVTARRNRRDPDNAIAAAKPIIDGLVLAGILAEDSFAVVRHLGIHREITPGLGGVRVEITPELHA